jgi:hypothetical protein
MQEQATSATRDLGSFPEIEDPHPTSASYAHLVELAKKCGVRVREVVMPDLIPDYIIGIVQAYPGVAIILLRRDIPEKAKAMALAYGISGARVSQEMHVIYAPGGEPGGESSPEEARANRAGHKLWATVRARCGE